MSSIITTGYTNSKNETFENLKVISYSKDNICGNLGKFVCETNHEDSYFLPERHLDGVYIYQSFTNPNVAYRIYKNFADYGFNSWEDAKLIYELNKRQENIKLTNFPTGIVTLENNIIGQEIPYFPNSMSIFEFSKLSTIQDVIPTRLYIKILYILKEMCQNGIYYLDNHPKNFLILNDQDHTIQTIDFDSTYVKFDDISSIQNKVLFDNFMKLVNICNKNFGLSDLKLRSSYNFDEMEEQLNDMENVILK